MFGSSLLHSFFGRDDPFDSDPFFANDPFFNTHSNSRPRNHRSHRDDRRSSSQPGVTIEEVDDDNASQSHHRSTPLVQEPDDPYASSHSSTHQRFGSTATDRRHQLQSRNNSLQSRRAQSMMDPFDHMFQRMGAMNSSIFGDMDAMFNDMHRSGGNGGVMQSYSYSSYSSHGPDGKPVHRSATHVSTNVNGVEEQKSAYTDSVRGVEKVRLKRAVNGRAREVIREKDIHSGEEKKIDNFYNISTEEAEHFDDEWQRAKQRVTNGERILLDSSRHTRTRPRLQSRDHDPLALPAGTGSTKSHLTSSSSNSSRSTPRSSATTSSISAPRTSSSSRTHDRIRQHRDERNESINIEKILR